MKKAILFYLIILLFACNQSSENNANGDPSKKMELESEVEKESVIDEEEIISDMERIEGRWGCG